MRKPGAGACAEHDAAAPKRLQGCGGKGRGGSDSGGTAGRAGRGGEPACALRAARRRNPLYWTPQEEGTIAHTLDARAR